MADDQQSEWKRVAAFKAAELVESGMMLGLGTGSTAEMFIDRLGELLKAGQLANIVGVATSTATADRASQLGIPLTGEDDFPPLDMAVDGADEVDTAFNLIKGRGGALLREKIVASQARQFIVVVDQNKLVHHPGQTGALPVEVTRFGWKTQARWLESIGSSIRLREKDGQPFVTENDNYILDCSFNDGIKSLESLAGQLDKRPGVVAHGLFLGMAHLVVVGGPNGAHILRRSN
jgi:ribose 5-phosphate isomerase A